MQIDINAMSQDIQYKLIASTVVPRPIALISTFGEETGDNAAPFSFFNVMGENPPVLVVGLETRRHDKSSFQRRSQGPHRHPRPPHPKPPSPNTHPNTSQ